MSQEWLDDRVHLLEADTNAMSLSTGEDGATVRRKRRSWSVEEKRGIVDESLEIGASIAAVARRHDLNANQLFYYLFVRVFQCRFSGVTNICRDPRQPRYNRVYLLA